MNFLICVGPPKINAQYNWIQVESKTKYDHKIKKLTHSQENWILESKLIKSSIVSGSSEFNIKRKSHNFLHIQESYFQVGETHQLFFGKYSGTLKLYSYIYDFYIWNNKFTK